MSNTTRKASAPTAQINPRTARKAQAQSKIKKTESSEIMNALHNEHKYLRSMLRGLEFQIVKLNSEDSADYQLLHDIMHYLSHYPDEYHHPREDLLFNKLVKRRPSILSDVDSLLEQHHGIAEQNRSLLNTTTRILAGETTADNGRLKRELRRYLRSYKEHIDLEEGKVFPAAYKTLKPDDWRWIYQQSRFVDDPVFGTSVKQEYQKTANYLMNELESLLDEAALAEFMGIEAMIESIVSVSEHARELGAILSDHGKQALRENAELVRCSLARNSEIGLWDLSRHLHDRHCQRLSASRAKLKKLFQTMRHDVIEPFSSRKRFM